MAKPVVNSIPAKETPPVGCFVPVVQLFWQLIRERECCRMTKSSPQLYVNFIGQFVSMEYCGRACYETASVERMLSKFCNKPRLSNIHFKMLVN
ncbi:hypothetical protein GPALN_014558 [Globodera pallida]|nr:hypothetical protein GPALN_014558 [Globodera pallida]